MNGHGLDLNSLSRRATFQGVIIVGLVIIFNMGLAVYMAATPGARRPFPVERFEWLFIIATGLAIISAALAFYVKYRLFFRPMISSKESFAFDYTRRTLKNNSVVCLFVEIIPILGLILFMKGGTLELSVIYNLVTAVLFVFARPTAGFLKNSLEAQERFVYEGRFLIEKKSMFGN